MDNRRLSLVFVSAFLFAVASQSNVEVFANDDWKKGIAHTEVCHQLSRVQGRFNNILITQKLRADGKYTSEQAVSNTQAEWNKVQQANTTIVSRIAKTDTTNQDRQAASELFVRYNEVVTDCESTIQLFMGGLDTSTLQINFFTSSCVDKINEMHASQCKGSSNQSKLPGNYLVQLTTLPGDFSGSLNTRGVCTQTGFPGYTIWTKGNHRYYSLLVGIEKTGACRVQPLMFDYEEYEEKDVWYQCLPMDFHDENFDVSKVQAKDFFSTKEMFDRIESIVNFSPSGSRVISKDGCYDFTFTNFGFNCSAESKCRPGYMDFGGCEKHDGCRLPKESATVQLERFIQLAKRAGLRESEDYKILKFYAAPDSDSAATAPDNGNTGQSSSAFSLRNDPLNSDQLCGTFHGGIGGVERMRPSC